MAKRTYKHLFGEGYITSHEDGTTSETTKDVFGDGYTTHNSDGTTSKTHKRKTIFGDEVIETFHQDGSRSVTTIDKHGNLKTRHSNGTETITTKDLFGTGYTTSDPYPSSGYTPSPTSAGGYLAVLGLAVFGILSIISLFEVKYAIVILPLLMASIVIRIFLTRKYNSGFFFLWLHPATLLCWRLFCQNYRVYLNEAKGIHTILGILFLIFIMLIGIIESEDLLDEHILYKMYAFFSLAGSVLSAFFDMPFNRTIPAMFGIALLATPIWLLVRWRKKASENNAIRNSQNKNGTRIIRIPADIKQKGIDKYYDDLSYRSSKFLQGSISRKLVDIWNAQGRPSKRNIATISEHYLVSMSYKFGQVGDLLTIVLRNGTKISAIIVSTEYGGYNGWGYARNGEIDIIKWQIKGIPSSAKNKSPIIDLTGWKGKKVAKVINHGTCKELK